MAYGKSVTLHSCNIYYNRCYVLCSCFLAFYVLFVVTPLCSNASELVSSLIFASKKKKENISMTFAQVIMLLSEIREVNKNKVDTRKLTNFMRPLQMRSLSLTVFWYPCWSTLCHVYMSLGSCGELFSIVQTYWLLWCQQKSMAITLCYKKIRCLLQCFSLHQLWYSAHSPSPCGNYQPMRKTKVCSTIVSTCKLY